MNTFLGVVVGFLGFALVLGLYLQATDQSIVVTLGDQQLEFGATKATALSGDSVPAPGSVDPRELSSRAAHSYEEFEDSPRPRPQTKSYVCTDAMGNNSYQDVPCYDDLGRRQFTVVNMPPLNVAPANQSRPYSRTPSGPSVFVNECGKSGPSHGSIAYRDCRHKEKERLVAACTNLTNQADRASGDRRISLKAVARGTCREATRYDALG